MKKKIAKYVLNYPKTTIILSIIITIILGSGLLNLRIEESLEETLPKDLPARQTLNELEDIFGGSDVMVLAIENEEETIFNKGTLSKIIEITESLETIDGIRKVTSLATVSQIEGKEWGMEITPFLEEVPETEAEIRALRKAFFADSLYVGTMVSSDEKYAAIIAILEGDADNSRILEEVNQLKRSFQGPEEIYISGLPVTLAAVSKNITDDIRRLIPFVIVVVIIILYLCLRTLSGVFLPLLPAAMSVVSMVGLMGHLDKPFMMVNNEMPIILIAVGISYAIHLIVGYYEELKYTQDKKEALTKTIEKVGTPVIMAGITTVVGFLSLGASSLPTIFEFGVFLAFGAFLAMSFTITVIPAALLLLPIPKKKISENKLGLMDRLLAGIGNFVFRFRYLVISLGIIMIIIFAFGIPLINIEMNPISSFPEHSDLRQADEKINKHLGGTVNMNFLVNGDIQSPAVLQEMIQIQQFLEEFPEVGSTMSMASLVEKMNRALHADDPQFERIPETKEAVAQAILLYDISASPEDYEQYVDYSFENGQIVAMLKTGGTKEISEITEKTEHFCDVNIPDKRSIKITGLSVFIKDLAQLIISSQIKSLILAIVLILILAWLTYRSLRIGLLAIIPVVLTVITNFGLMGFLGIDLSIPTVMISSIIIGIGIDFSFHFISRYKIETRISDSTSPVVRTTRSVGKAILSDATPTAFGFLILMASGFVPIRFMGFLIALTMMVCAFGALTILAAALTFIKIK